MPLRSPFNGVSNGSDTNNRYQLTGGSTSSPNGYETVIRLIQNDLNAIKRRTGLSTSINDTFISIAAELISDVAGQPVSPIITSMSFPAGNFTEDTTPPTLADFILNVNDGTLELMFSETVNISSLNSTAITLQNTANIAMASVVFMLTGGTPRPDMYEVSFDLSFTTPDLNILKTFTDLGTSILDTYIAIEAAAIFDMNDNPLVAIEQSQALQAAMFTADVNLPVLLNFTFDLNNGMLVFTLSESVSYTDVNPPQITIQNAVSVSNSEDYQSLLNGGTVNPVGWHYSNNNSK